jgi:hypothetical protein
VLIQRGDTHGIRNTGDVPLCTLNLYVPPAYTEQGEELLRDGSEPRWPVVGDATGPWPAVRKWRALDLRLACKVLALRGRPRLCESGEVTDLSNHRRQRTWRAWNGRTKQCQTVAGNGREYPGKPGTAVETDQTTCNLWKVWKP